MLQAMDAMLDAELEGQHDFEDDFDELDSGDNAAELGTGANDAPDLQVGENDEELPADARAAAEAHPDAVLAEQAGENPDEHAGAAHAQPQAAAVEEDEEGTPRGSENAARNARGVLWPAAVAPARMAAGNGGVPRVDSHSVRSVGGEESTVLCAMDALDEASIGEACTSRASPWEFGGMLVWGKKRKR